MTDTPSKDNAQEPQPDSPDATTDSTWFNRDHAEDPTQMTSSASSMTKAEKKAQRKAEVEAKRAKTWYGRLWQEWIRPIGSVLLVVIAIRSTLIDYNTVPTGSMQPTIEIGDRVLVNKLAYGWQWPLSGPTLDVPLLSRTAANGRKEPVSFSNPLRFLRHLNIHWGDGPQRGEIVTFFSPEDQRRLIKRVVALPGDTVFVNNQILYLNGEATEFRILEPDDERIPQPPLTGATYVEETVAGHTRIIAYGDPGGRWAWANVAEFTLGEDQYLMMGDHRDHSKDGRAFARDGLFVSRDDISGRAFSVLFSLDGWAPRWSRLFESLR